MSEKPKTAGTSELYRLCPNGHESEHTQEAKFCPACGAPTSVKQKLPNSEVDKAGSEGEGEGSQAINTTKQAQEQTDSSLLIQKLDGVVGELQGLQKLFADRLRYDEAKEKAIETLANELAESTANHEFSLKKGFINILISLYDRLSETEESFEKGAEARKRISNLKQELLDKLYMEDIEPIKMEDGSLFDNRLQKAVGRVITLEMAEDQKIQKITQEGFIQGERIIRPQGVVIFRYSEQGA
jgi:molecular chaperone GrpE